VQRLAERADEQRLAEAGNSFEEGVTAGEEAGQYAVDDLFMSDHGAPDLFADASIVRAEFFDGGGEVFVR
jgi:hypothetical protein